MKEKEEAGALRELIEQTSLCRARLPVERVRRKGRIGALAQRIEQWVAECGKFAHIGKLPGAVEREPLHPQEHAQIRERRMIPGYILVFRQVLPEPGG